jgi:hypothetical protein
MVCGAKVALGQCLWFLNGTQARFVVPKLTMGQGLWCLKWYCGRFCGAKSGTGSLCGA